MSFEQKAAPPQVLPVTSWRRCTESAASSLPQAVRCAACGGLGTPQPCAAASGGVILQRLPSRGAFGGRGAWGSI